LWIAAALPFLTRLLLRLRFGDRWFGLLLHPLGIALFLAIQYSAFFAARRGMEAKWRGRSYSRG
jgi:hypothetical protein